MGGANGGKNSDRIDNNQSLVDGGANGGIAGQDMVLHLYHPDNVRVNIGGVDNHQVNNVCIGTYYCLIYTDLGPVIGVFHNYASIPSQSNSIHSKIQMQAYGQLVCDNARAIGGKQRILTSDGYQISLSVTGSLLYMNSRAPTPAEIADPAIPMVIMTSDDKWNP